MSEVESWVLAFLLVYLPILLITVPACLVYDWAHEPDHSQGFTRYAKQSLHQSANELAHKLKDSVIAVGRTCLDALTNITRTTQQARRKIMKPQQAKPQRLLWIDIETTGLNPNKDSILEIETRITNKEANHTYDKLHLIIKPTTNPLTRMDPKVQHMHTTNNLIEETKTGTPPQTAWRLLNAHLKHASHQATLHPTGSSIHFDIDFLKPHIPNLNTYTNHQWNDLTTIRNILQDTNPEALAAIEEGLPKTDDRTGHCLDRDMEQYRRMIAWCTDRA
ncbi:exonuclease domain-containing protein [Bifidobacterium indicum]|uniref:exonuclease domain-containing protein n=1 Tax=Bifidobacterium indicum TaxID=1691 RepID=UPI0030DCA27C